MKDDLKEMYKLMKDYDYVFLDEDFVDVDDIQEEIDNKRNNDMCDEEILLLPVYATKPITKPEFSFDDLGDKLESHSYDTENAQGTDLIEEDEDVLKLINELFNSIVSPIYSSEQELFSILIYADEEKGFGIIKKGE